MLHTKIPLKGNPVVQIAAVVQMVSLAFIPNTLSVLLWGTDSNDIHRQHLTK